jgi:hypothetical protein
MRASKSLGEKITCNGFELELETNKDGVSEFVYDVYYHHRHAGSKVGEIDFESPEAIDQVRKWSRPFTHSASNISLQKH